MELIAKATIQIQKPVQQVFEAVVNPGIMTHYFISESTGRMEEGRELVWKFPEFPAIECPVKDIKIEPNRSVSFVWDVQTVVSIQLEEQPGPSTVVRIAEDGKANDEEGLKWLVRNTEGWANFLACMKAYLEYGIHLRKGAFEFMKQQ